MLNYKKPLIFDIQKIIRNENTKETDINNIERDLNLRKRSPWTKEEDDAIICLVKQFGTKNWTLLASKIGEIYGYNHRSGKQCRERWHNHLDPNIKKEYWTEKEEAVLFYKHMEFGNRWSDIAKFLPGRTDNSIKNHFYSKLRKFIRKILKVLLKENVFRDNDIDSLKYDSDRIYKIIKRQRIPYNSLSKDSIVDLIIKHNINSRNDNNKQNLTAKNSKFSKKIFLILEYKKDDCFVRKEASTEPLSMDVNRIITPTSCNVEICYEENIPILGNQSIPDYKNSDVKERKFNFNHLINNSNENILDSIGQLNKANQRGEQANKLISNSNLNANSNNNSQTSHTHTSNISQPSLNPSINNLINNMKSNPILTPNPSQSDLTIKILQDLSKLSANMQTFNAEIENNINNINNFNNIGYPNNTLSSMNSLGNINSMNNSLTSFNKIAMGISKKPSLNSQNSSNNYFNFPSSGPNTIKGFVDQVKYTDTNSFMNSGFKNIFNQSPVVTNNLNNMILNNNFFNNEKIVHNKILINNENEELLKDMLTYNTNTNTNPINNNFNSENPENNNCIELGKHFTFNVEGNNDINPFLNFESKSNTSKSFYPMTLNPVLKGMGVEQMNKELLNFKQMNESNVGMNLNALAAMKMNLQQGVNNNVIDVNNYDKFKSFCEVQQSINNTKTSQEQSDRSPKGLSISPKSAFVKNMFNKYS